MTFFFYGTLCHPALLRVVLGREAVSVPATLADCAVHWAQTGPFPVLAVRAAAKAMGKLVQGLTP